MRATLKWRTLLKVSLRFGNVEFIRQEILESSDADNFDVS